MARRLLSVQENVPLLRFCTLEAGGPARYWIRAETREDAEEAVTWARDRSLPLLIVGGGSNLLVADSGFPGLALQVAIRGLAWSESDRTVKAQAGEPWDALVAASVDRGWAGLECLSGIPGLVGATPIQNVGAYGQEVAETIVDVEAVDTDSGRTARFANSDCRFGYRASRFKREDRDRYLILSVSFRLEPNAAPAVRYGDVERALAGRGLERPSLRDVRERVLEIRRRKSMLLDPADPNHRSAGSFFMNPFIPAQSLEAVRTAAARQGGNPEDVPAFPASPGRVKLSAAWLIEHAGFARGDTRGPVGLSSNHALALVNRGGASAAQIAAFAREIRDRVQQRFGVVLEPEPVLVGLSL